MTAETDDGASSDLVLLLVDRVLDWPFLFFVLGAIAILVFRREMSEMFRARQLEIKIAGAELSLGEAVERLDENQAITYADLESLQAQIDQIKSGQDAATGPTVPDTVALDRMRDGLRDSRYVWRSIDRLALLAGISKDHAHGLLAGQADIKIGMGKSGKEIARLVSED